MTGEPRVRAARSPEGVESLRGVSNGLEREVANADIDIEFGDAGCQRHFGDESWLEEDVLVWAPLPPPVRPNPTRTALLAGDGRASAMLRRRDRLARARRLPRRRTEAWR